MGKQKMAGFVHTTPPTIGMVDRFMKLVMPEILVVHMYDGMVKIENFQNPVGQTPKRNMRKYVAFAEELERAGCDLIAGCCSLMPRAVAYAAKAVDVPFVQLDAPILKEASVYGRIGAVITTPYTVPYITEQLESFAALQGRKPDILFSNTNEALKLFNAGDFTGHDEMIIKDMHVLEQKGVDCILMGQIPMGMMEERIAQETFRVPVLVPGMAAFVHLSGLLK